MFDPPTAFDARDPRMDLGPDMNGGSLPKN